MTNQSEGDQLDTKTKIMNTALQLFSDKGFNETSVQQIAQLTGISKGGFYNHFSTKRELMLEMIDEYHNKIMNNSHILNETNLHLATYIQYELEAWMENQTFIHVLFNEFHPNKDPQITNKMDELHSRLTQQHREIFYLCYGEKIKPYLTDIVIIFEGMLKEYLSYMFVQQTTFDVKQLSMWICHHIESIINHLEELDPFLLDTTDETIESVLKDLQHTIERKESSNKMKLLQVVDLLEQALENEAAYSTNVEVYLHYLKKEKTIQTNVLKLERLCKTRGALNESKYKSNRS